MLELLDEEELLEELLEELDDEDEVVEPEPPGVPNTRHSRMPVDCCGFNMETRKRLVVMPASDK